LLNVKICLVLSFVCVYICFLSVLSFIVSHRVYIVRYYSPAVAYEIPPIWDTDETSER
jgi:hypothetical protein